MHDPERAAFFHRLYDRYHRAIFAYMLAHVNHRENAKDLLQELFLRIWNHLHVGMELGVDESRYWIYRMAKNVVIDTYRRRSTQSKTQQKVKSDVILRARVTHSAEEQFETKGRVQLLEQAIEQLPAELHRVLMLQLIGKLNSSEIGEMLSIPSGTVRYRLSMALKFIRQQLAQAEGEENRYGTL